MNSLKHLMLRLTFISSLLPACNTMSAPTPLPVIPSAFASAIKSDCRQVVLVQATNIKSTQGVLWLLERQSTGWQVVQGPEPVTLGRKGLAWGLGLHTSKPPSGISAKREGDNCTPLGVFEIPFLFGDEPTSAVSYAKLPYQQMTSHHAGVDDSHSRFYNQIVDSRKVPVDWKNAESMIPSGGGYRRGIFVAHNPQNLPRSGSCIFLHLWLKPGESTSGCTAMSLETMEKLFRRLDPALHPLLVQTLIEQ